MASMKIKKLNNRGFSHHIILPIIAIMVIASVGTYFVMHSEASPSGTSTRTPGTSAFYAKNPLVKYDNAGKKCAKGMTKGVKSLKKFVNQNYRPVVTKIGDFSCRPNTANPTQLSVHSSGRALDVHVNAYTSTGLKTGNQIRDYMIANSTRLGIQTVIWNGKVWSSDKDGLRKYTGPYPHDDHLHIEINKKASKKRNLAQSSSCNLISNPLCQVRL